MRFALKKKLWLQIMLLSNIVYDKQFLFDVLLHININYLDFSEMQKQILIEYYCLLFLLKILSCLSIWKFLFKDQLFVILSNFLSGLIKDILFDFLISLHVEGGYVHFRINNMTVVTNIISYYENISYNNWSNNIFCYVENLRKMKSCLFF